jgi:hypothetical protein
MTLHPLPTLMLMLTKPSASTLLQAQTMLKKLLRIAIAVTTMELLLPQLLLPLQTQSMLTMMITLTT